MAIAFKGWMTEEELKHKVSYQNLLLYSLVLPSVGDEGKTESQKKPVDMFSFFNSIGED